MKENTLNIYHQRMLLVLQYIQKHLQDDLDPETLAGVAYFSPPHFQRIFKAMVGETLGEHIRRIRLEWAVHSLAYSNRPVTEIAFDAGYETLESFSRAFKSKHGVSPGNFRKSGKLRVTDRTRGVHYSPEGLSDFGPESFGESLLDVRIEDFGPVTVAYLRHVGPYETCGKTWERLCKWAEKNNLVGPDTEFMGICYDNPRVTPQEKIRYEACLSVSGEVEPEGEIGIKVVGPEKCAVTTHIGPYDGLQTVYNDLYGRWLPNSGLELLNIPNLEIYRNSPDFTPPEELVTDVLLFVE